MQWNACGLSGTWVQKLDSFDILRVCGLQPQRQLHYAVLCDDAQHAQHERRTPVFTQLAAVTDSK